MSSAKEHKREDKKEKTKEIKSPSQTNKIKEEKINVKLKNRNEIEKEKLNANESQFSSDKKIVEEKKQINKLKENKYNSNNNIKKEECKISKKETLNKNDDDEINICLFSFGDCSNEIFGIQNDNLKDNAMKKDEVTKSENNTNENEIDENTLMGNDDNIFNIFNHKTDETANKINGTIIPEEILDIDEKLNENNQYGNKGINNFKNIQNRIKKENQIIFEEDINDVIFLKLIMIRIRVPSLNLVLILLIKRKDIMKKQKKKMKMMNYFMNYFLIIKIIMLKINFHKGKEKKQKAQKNILKIEIKKKIKEKRMIIIQILKNQKMNFPIMKKYLISTSKKKKKFMNIHIK